MVLKDPKAVDYGENVPHLDDILICGMCGCPSKVTLLGTEELTDEELKGLTLEERKGIEFAIRAVKRQVRNN
jgi:hypothetical protein